MSWCMANDVQVAATIWLRGGGFKEQPGVVGGVIIRGYVCVIVDQGETIWPRATIIRIEDSDSEVQRLTVCLPTLQPLWGWCSMLPSCPDTIHMWAI